MLLMLEDYNVVHFTILFRMVSKFELDFYIAEIHNHKKDFNQPLYLTHIPLFNLYMITFTKS